VDRLDVTFGPNINFLESLPKDYYYFAYVLSNTQVFLKNPGWSFLVTQVDDENPKGFTLCPVNLSRKP
jgi:hypothetical protein